MSLLPFLTIAFGGGTATLLLRRWPLVAAAVGLTAIATAVIAALVVNPGERLALGGGAIVTTGFLRLFLVLGGGTALLGGVVAVLALPAGWPRNLPGAALIGLGAAGLGLSLADAGTAVQASVAAGLAGVIVTARVPATRRGIGVAARELRAIAIAAGLVLGAVAWFARPADLLGEIGPDATVIGVAYLAVVLGIAVRFGAIPFHLWAARVADAAPEAALPLILAWLPAVLALVGLAWIDGSIRSASLAGANDLAVERALVAGIGILSFLFGAIAAWIQDDLEHVVGYSIVQDAGIVVLALASIDPQVWQPARTWIVVLLALRTAFAVWVVAVRGRFGSRRVSELHGWARRSPLLGIGLAVIAIGSIGVPGLTAFEARSEIVGLAIGDPLRTLVLAGALLPLLYYGRLLVVGLDAPRNEIARAPSDRPVVPGRRVAAGSASSSAAEVEAVRRARMRRGWRQPADGLAVATDIIELNRGPIVAVLVLVLCVVGLAVAAGAFGLSAAAAESWPSP